MTKKYPSIFSPGKQVTAAQYAAELVCDRYARSNSTDLPDKFWELPYWKGYYQRQVIMASMLIKKYGGSTVLKAMSHADARYIISFKQKRFQVICQSILDNEPKVEQSAPQERTYDNRGVNRSKTTKLDALDE